MPDTTTASPPSAPSPLPSRQPAAYTGTFISTPTYSTLSTLSSHTAYVSSSGHITHLLPSTTPAPPPYTHLTPTVLPATSFYFPGLIDTHIHASQYANAGIFGNSTLLHWLETYTFPLETSLSDLTRARTVYSRCIARALANGTTTAAYFATQDRESSKLLAALTFAAGQRAFVGRCVMDRNAPDGYRDSSVEQGVKDTVETIRYCETLDPTGELVAAVVTPRFAPSCSGEMLAALGEVVRAEKGVRVQTHVSENRDEVAWVKALFPEREGYMDVYRHYGLLGPRTVLAHAVHVTEEEVSMVVESGAGVSHCPVSNGALGSGCAKVQELVRRGVKVGLGSDVGGGYACSVLENVRQATLVSKLVATETGNKEDVVTVAEALWMATRGGAEVLGLEGKTGAFEVGMLWDAIEVSLGQVDGEGKTKVRDNAVDLFGWESWEERVCKWVYNGDERNIQNTWVAGRLVYSKDGDE